MSKISRILVALETPAEAADWLSLILNYATQAEVKIQFLLLRFVSCESPEKQGAGEKIYSWMRSFSDKLSGTDLSWQMEYFPLHNVQEVFEYASKEGFDLICLSGKRPFTIMRRQAETGLRPLYKMPSIN